jgi:DNA-binding MarR family transcriptional regulator
MSTEGPPVAVTSRLGYLLKHAQLRLAEIAEPLVSPHGVGGRELGVMLVLDQPAALSQQEAASRLGIDRTTMVAMVDALESKGLVRRRPAPDDRRRNLVELTPAGAQALRLGSEATDVAERELLSGLTDAEAAAFRDALHRVVTGRSADQ